MPLPHRLSLVFLCGLCVSVVNLAAVNPARAQALPRVVIRTDLGDIEVDVDSIRAPITSANRTVAVASSTERRRKSLFGDAMFTM